MAIGKRLKKDYEGIDPTVSYDLAEAVKLVKTRSKTKFDETVEIALNLNLDPRKADQNLRGTVLLPNGTGKTLRVAVFARGDRAKDAEAAGADLVGAEDLAEKVQAGQIEFDRCIATPDMMAVVGRLGKVLGPRGLMPNPKTGTVTQDVATAVKETKAGKVEFRVDKTGVIHVPVGKVSFASDKLLENANSLLQAVVKAKPAAAKGKYVRSVTICSTMGPGVALDVSPYNQKAV